jgi:hypothetical protein
MRTPAKCGAWLLPLLLTGCIFHKTNPTPALKLAPPIQPSRPLELAVVDIPPAQSVIAARPIYNMKEEAVPIKQPVRHHRSISKPVEVPEAAMNPAPAVNAIGEGGLTSADPASSRHQTEDSIAAVERGLNGINRSLDDSEQKTVGQIREFLKQAKAALASGDTDGAHTLTEKAKALLAELTK